MDTNYARHTMVIGIDQATRERLWSDQLVAVHVPHDIDGNVPSGPDNISLNPDDHDQGGRKRLRALLRVAQYGGFVYAEYPLSESDKRYLLGKVLPASQLEVLDGTWGGRYGLGDRPAALLFVRLVDAMDTPTFQRSTAAHCALQMAKCGVKCIRFVRIKCRAPRYAFSSLHPALIPAFFRSERRSLNAVSTIPAFHVRAGTSIARVQCDRKLVT